MSSHIPEIDDSNMFRLDPLDKTRGQIRLLELSPRFYEHDIVHCHIHTVDLSAKPKYRALSYEWGPETPLREIRIGTSSLFIRENLWQCLTVLVEEKDGAGFFWIDQICINQSDDQERNHQVQLMREIYKNAVEVIVWLGHLDDRNLVQVRLWVDLRRRETWESYEFIDILGKSYWQRVWIVQELMLAQLLKFYHGHTPLNVDEIIQCCDLANHQSIFRGTLVHGQAERIKSLLKKDFYSASGLTLVDMLIHLDPAPLHCTDPRDLIFGLLGLVRKSEQIPVDYTWTNEQTFEALLEGLIMRPGLSYNTTCGTKLCGNLRALRSRFSLPIEYPVWCPEFGKHISLDWKLEEFIRRVSALEEIGLAKGRWTMPQLARIALAVPVWDLFRYRWHDDEDDDPNPWARQVYVMNTIKVTELEKSLRYWLGEPEPPHSNPTGSNGWSLNLLTTYFRTTDR